MAEDSDTESFHSAECDDDAAARQGGRIDAGLDDSPQSGSATCTTDSSAVPDSPKLCRPRPASLCTSAEKAAGERPAEAPPATAEAGDGWDAADDWGDLTEADMVTPREALPAINITQLAISDSAGASPQGTARAAACNSAEHSLDDWAWGSLLHSGHTLLQDVIDTVNTGLGAPTPEDLAGLSESERRALEKKCDEIKEPPVEGDDCGSVTEEATSESGASGDNVEPPASATTSGTFPTLMPSLNVSNFLSGFTKTGTTLVSGSLDVLETLGKKTFDVLTVPQSADAKSRRLVFDPRSHQQSLSQVLRELKSETETRAASAAAERHVRLLSYAYQFERFEGTAQLEGLEMVSENCDRQTRSQHSTVSTAVAQTIEHADDVFAAIDTTADAISDSGPVCGERDFASTLNGALEQLHLPYNPSRLIEVEERSARQLAAFNVASAPADELELAGGSGRDTLAALQVRTLAEYTARCVECVHKVAQLVLAVPQPPATPENFVFLSEVLCEQLELVTDRLANCVNANAEAVGSTHTDELLTNLFLEANNSCGYVRNAAKLLRPVVQLAYVHNGGQPHGKHD